MIPHFNLVINGRNETENFINIATCTLIDNRAFQADTLSISVPDPENQISLPNENATIDFSFGFRGQPIHNKGKFVVDGHSLDLEPDVISVNARSANLRENINVQKSRSFKQTSIGEIISDIAKSQNLVAEVNPDIANISIAHLDQTNESDGHLISRLGRLYGAVASIKDDRLVFIPLSRGQTVAGTPIKPTLITREMCAVPTNHRVNYQAQEFSEVIARYRDLDDATIKTVSASRNSKDGLKTKTINRIFPDEIQAKAAAEGELRHLSDKGRSMEITLKQGIPSLIPETPIRVSGFKAQIDEISWICDVVTHTVNQSGLHTSLKLVPLSQS